MTINKYSTAAASSSLQTILIKLVSKTFTMMISIRSMFFWISAILLCGCMTTTTTITCVNALGEDSYGTKPSQKQAKVRRDDGLDHWDSDTLAYYLDEYPGYDLAVMFYAPWDSYSQRLAPYWNQIAHILDAGTTQSKLIMVS